MAEYRAEVHSVVGGDHPSLGQRVGGLHEEAHVVALLGVGLVVGSQSLLIGGQQAVA